MQRCLELAVKARGNTSPNPMVGAVIVKNGVIIGEGYHHAAGSPHAEIEAISKAVKCVADSTLYVNLEPCCCHGRTPPCTEAIIKHKIKHVFIATLDPNPQVCGNGVKKLQDAGIEVNIGLLANEASKVNEVFFKYITTGMPFIILKSAISLDGKIATDKGRSQWISSLDSRTDAHYLRRSVDGIMVGVETVLKDDPNLTVRLVDPPLKQPVAFVIDPALRTPLRAQLVQRRSQEKTIVITSINAPRYKIAKLKEMSVDCLIFNTNERGVISLSDMLNRIGQMGITSILIEGGSSLAANALKEAVVDKIVYYIAPKIIGGSTAPGPVGGSSVDSPEDAIALYDVQVTQTGSDIRVEAYIKKG